MAILGLFYLLFIAFIFLIVVGGTVLWICALVSCLQNETANDNNKVVWLLVIFFLHFLGALLYFLIRRPQRIRELGR